MSADLYITEDGVALCHKHRHTPLEIDGQVAQPVAVNALARLERTLSREIRCAVCNDVLWTRPPNDADEDPNR